MKVIWEAADIHPGMHVRKPQCNETWMIGYDPTVHGEQTPAFALISLSDGMICVNRQNAEQIAAFLNDAGNQPVVLIDSLAIFD